MPLKVAERALIHRSSVRREWNEDILKYLASICEEKYCEYNHEPFRKVN